MAQARSTFDWPGAYARLEQLRRYLEAGGAVAPAEVGRVLRERAQALARPLAEAPTTTDVLDLVVFTLAGRRYSIEAAHVLEVIPRREWAPVPCTPPCILGVINHRGRILPILDCHRLFALAVQEVAAESRMVVVEAGGMTFGLLVDAVPEVMRVGVHEVIPSPLPSLHDQPAFLRGVTDDMVAILDLEALARDPRITVDEEVG